MSQILALIKASEKLVEALPAEALQEEVIKAGAKVRKPKKVTPAIKKAAVKKKASVAKKVAKKASK